MKILYVIPTMGCGGAEILLGSIAKDLVKKGHEVHIVSLFPHHHTWPNYPEKENLLEKVPLSIIGGGVHFKFLRNPTIDNQAFKSYVKEFAPDIIHSHLYLAELLSRSLIIEGIKYFSHGHDNMSQLKKLSTKTFFSKTHLANYWERLWLKKKYLQCTNQFIAISEDVKQYLTDNLGEFKNHIHLVPNAINTSRFYNDRVYSPVNETLHIVSIANLVPKKNHILLIGVMEILLMKGYNVTLDVLGAGPLMDSLKNETKEKGLENHLRFLGSVGDIPERLKKAQLFAHPALYEPFGLVILEAMASGLPVVSLDGFGNRELMKEGDNGFMLPNNSTAEDFAEKIIYFFKNPTEIERMGKFAVEFSKQYDIDNYTDRLLEIYQKN
jgi:glycosyltransferase involved in cell wall biosynthesis